MSDDAPLLEVEGLTVRFGGEAAVDRVSLHIRAGEIVTLIGPNGSGKTTLLRAALGLAPADGGRSVRRAGLRVGYVPQSLDIDAALPLRVRRFVELSGVRDAAAVRHALDAVGAGHLLNTAMRSLSGGEARRVLLARALVRRPHLLVLDEPTAGVDVGGQSELYRLIARIRDEQGCGVLLVSHDLHLVMAATDRVVCLNRHVCCTGSPEDVALAPEYLALFGGEVAGALAPYTHHHDHSHDLHGDVAH